MQTSVLWADRNTVFTVLGRHYLEAAGMYVETADDALGCLQQLEFGTHNVLILDDSLLWGGIDGVLDWVRSELPTAQQPAVIVSGNDQPERLSDRTGVPRERCISKPFRLLTMLQTVADAARSRHSELRENPSVPSLGSSGRRVSSSTGRARHWMEVENRLSNHVYQALSAVREIRHPGDIAVMVDGGHVRLEGCVSSIHARQVAQSAVMAVCGVKDVANGLYVG